MHINIKRLIKKANNHGYNIIVNVNKSKGQQTYKIIDTLTETDLFLTNDIVQLRNEIDRITTPIDHKYIYFDSDTDISLDK